MYPPQSVKITSPNLSLPIEILIFCNKAPVYWYSKYAPSVESSTFGAEFYAMRIAVDMVKALHYKLRIFGIPVDGPANVFCDNEAVYKNTVLPESVLNKKNAFNCISYL